MRTTLITMFFLFSLPIHSSTLRKIELKGKSEPKLNRSLSSSPQVLLDDNIISVKFYNAITNVTITIIDPYGEIEKRTQSFIGFQSEIFEVVCQGMYTITITTPTGTDLYGTFYIE